MKTRITISGPGGCINGAMEVVAKALEEYGAVVKVENNHPSRDTQPLTPLALEGFEIELKADHLPWGG